MGGTFFPSPWPVIRMKGRVRFPGLNFTGKGSCPFDGVFPRKTRFRIAMSEPSLSDLLLQWEEMRDRGESVTAESLCRDCPELLDELKCHIRARENVDVMLLSDSGCSLLPEAALVSLATPPSQWPELSGYTILSELGRGGMGVVYKAKQIRPERLVAIKMLLRGHRPTETELTRFRREAEMVASLRHPNLVAVYEVGEYAGAPFCSMEYVSGGSLPEWTRGQPQPPRQAAELVRTLADAIHAVHQRGVVHRDLKPGNVLLDVGGSEIRPGTTGAESSWPENATPKLVDFGLARRVDEVDGLTVSGAILGTPSYMAPEQARGDTRHIGPAADIYGLGTILYELLTGRPPFHADTPWDTVRQVTTQEPTTPRHLQPHVPRDLQTICLKCLEKDVPRRYGSAAALAEDLRRFLADEPIAARRIGPIGRAVKWSRRHPAGAGLLAVLLLSAAVFTVGSVLHAVRISQLLHETQAQAEESRQRLVRLHVAQGTRLLDEGEWLRSLPWFVEALQLDAGHPESEQTHRVRIAATLRQCPRLVRLGFHEGRIVRVQFSHGGQRILTASADGSACLWNCGSGNDPPLVLSHGSPLRDATFSPDGQSVATAAEDGTARIWNASTGRQLVSLRHASPVNSCQFSPDGRRLLTASDDGTACVWHVPTGLRAFSPLVHGRSVHKAVFDKAGLAIATASEDSDARLWDSASGRPLTDRLRHDGPVLDVAFAPDGGTIATASSDGAARVWNARTGERLSVLRHRQSVLQVVFSPDGSRIATASDDHTACLWPATGQDRSGRPIRHRSGVNTVGFSPDGRVVVTGADDNVACVWDVFRGERLPPSLPHGGSVNDTAFHPNGRLLATVSNDHAMRLWELGPSMPTRNEASNVSDRKEPSKNRWISADGRLVAVLDGDLRVRVHEVASGKPVGPPLEHSSTVVYAAFSEDNRQLVSAGDDNRAYLWDWTTGNLLATPLLHMGTVCYATFSPDGRRVFTACANHTLRAWDAATGEPLTPPLHSPLAERLAVFRGNGDHLEIIFSNETSLVIDLTGDDRGGEDLRRLAELLAGGRVHPSRGFLPFSPDGLRAVWQESPLP